MNYAYNVREQNAEALRIMEERAKQNMLLNSYNAFNQNSYGNQMNRIFASNPILNQQIVQSRQDQVLNQMKNIEEIEFVKKLQNQVRSKEIDEVEMLRRLVIMPIKIEKKNDDVEPRFCFVKGSWEHERDVAWAKKTNQPYKNIIPQKADESDSTGFDYKQKINKGEIEKLTIHKVTELDKNKKKFEKEHRVKRKTRKDLNSENKLTYSLDNYTKHKKYFDYEHIYTFRIKHDSKSHDDLKFDRIKYHEEKQKEREKNKIFKDRILELLDNDGVVNEQTQDNESSEPSSSHSSRKSKKGKSDSDDEKDINVEDLLKEILETQEIIDEEKYTREKNKTADEELEELLNAIPSTKELENQELEKLLKNIPSEDARVHPEQDLKQDLEQATNGQPKFIANKLVSNNETYDSEMPDNEFLDILSNELINKEANNNASFDSRLVSNSASDETDYVSKLLEEAGIFNV